MPLNRVLYYILATSGLFSAAYANHRVPNYTVQAGETLEILAKRTGFPIKSLLQLNHLTLSELTAGQNLYLPKNINTPAIGNSDESIVVKAPVVPVPNSNNAFDLGQNSVNYTFLERNYYEIIEIRMLKTVSIRELAQNFKTTKELIRRFNGMYGDFASINTMISIPIFYPTNPPVIQYVENSSPVKTTAPPLAQPTTPIPIQQNSMSYSVKRGDTLKAIANKYKTSLELLIRFNRLSNPNHLEIGQVILIPKL